MNSGDLGGGGGDAPPICGRGPLRPPPRMPSDGGLSPPYGEATRASCYFFFKGASQDSLLPLMMAIGSKGPVRVRVCAC